MVWLTESRNSFLTIVGPGKFRVKTDAISGERMIFSLQTISSPRVHTYWPRQGSSWGRGVYKALIPFMRTPPS